MAESYSVEAVLKAKVDGFVNGFKQATSAAEDFVSKNQRTFDSFRQVGAAATAGGIAIAAGLGASVKIASDFQSSFAGVRKTVEASETQFKVLEKGIRNMSKELPASASSIAEVAESAGQLGIKKENILGFTRTMIDLGEATNLTADEAATALAQFANVVQMPQENFDRLGSSIVALGNNLATTEADIVNMAMRLSGVGAQVGLTEAEIMALSGTMASVGINAEAGGSAMSMVMKKIQNAVSDGGKDLKGFAEASGMTSKEFAEAWKNDPITALDSFIKGLGKSGESGENLNAILSDLGIKGIQETDTLLRLAGASDLLGEAVDISTTAWENNSALAEEAGERYKTFESKVSMLKNTITDIGISIGNVLLPAVTKMVEFVQSLAEKFSNLDERAITIIAVIATLAAGFLLLTGPILLLIGFIPSMLAGFTALSTVFAAITGPIGLTIAAIVAIGAALVVAYTQFEWFRDVVNAVWQAIVGVIMSAVDGIVAFVQDIASQITQYWNENGELIRSATENVWNAIKTVISTVMPIIQGIISAVWTVIQVIVMSVWENIKGVIQGALDIILGLVKTFAGLFTGDWSAMWDGIKQMFSGAVQFLWNLVQLMLWGRLLKGIAAFAGAFRGAATTMWNAIRGVFTSAITAIRNFFTNGFNAMRNVANTTMSSMRSIISTVWNTIKSVFTTVVSSIRTTVSTGFQNVVNAIRTSMTNAVNTVRTKMSDMLSKVKEYVSKFFNAGKDLIQGLIDGIKNMTAAAIGAITGVVDGVVNKAKSLLGIKSPSRVFMEIGKDTGAGLVKGIKGSESDAENASASLTESLIEELVEMQKNAKEQVKVFGDEILVELETIKSNWLVLIDKMMNETRERLKAMYGIGRFAGQGLLDGLASMEPALLAKARAIADAIKATIQSALDINSPSRWMRDMIGKNMMLGWIDGMEAMKSKVVATSVNATDWMKPDVPVVAGINIPSFPQRGDSGSYGRHDKPVSDNRSSSSSGDLIQNIHFHNVVDSPSENSRKMKQQSRDLLNEWRR